MIMNFRKMQQKVIFQNLPVVDDGFGGNANGSDDWVDMLSTWGNMQPIFQGNEALENGKLQSISHHKLEIRYRSGFTPNAKYRVKFGSRIFDVLYFRNVNEANKVLKFRLKEVV